MRELRNRSIVVKSYPNAFRNHGGSGICEKVNVHNDARKGNVDALPTGTWLGEERETMLSDL